MIVLRKEFYRNINIKKIEVFLDFVWRHPNIVWRKRGGGGEEIKISGKLNWVRAQTPNRYLPNTS